MNELIPLLQVVATGLITGLIALLAIEKTHRKELEKDDRREEYQIEGFLKSVYVEIKVLWERYSTTMGKQVESLNEGKALLIYYPLTQDYFTIYNSNAALIGKIENDQLRSSIVSTYTKAKGLVDSYKMNNEMILKYENWYLLDQQTKHEIFKRQASMQLAVMIDYAKKIKSMHNEVKKDINNLLEELRKKQTK